MFKIPEPEVIKNIKLSESNQHPIESTLLANWQPAAQSAIIRQGTSQETTD